MYNCAIQTLDSAGLDDKSFYWNDWTEWPAESGKYPGFWDDGSESPATLVVKPGDGLWIQGGDDNDAIQTAGEVGREDIVSTWSEDGFKLVANSFPLGVSINDISFSAGDMYSVAIQTLDSAGLDDKSFYWNDWTEWPAESGEYPGFWDDGSETPATYVVKPGQAIWAQAVTGDSLRIPAPEL